MHLLITYNEALHTFTVDDPEMPGSPAVGRGATMAEALGEWLLQNQHLVHIHLDVDESAQWAEEKRRQDYEIDQHPVAVCPHCPGSPFADTLGAKTR